MAEWLRTRRKRVGIESQEKFAERLQIEGYDVSRAQVGHWETGHSPLPLDDEVFRKAISIVLRMPLSEILKLSGYEVEEVQSEEAKRAAYIIDHLPAEDRDKALRILEALLVS